MDTQTVKKGRKKWVKWAVIGGIIVLIIVIILVSVGCAAKKLNSAFETGDAAMRDITVIVSSTGIVEPESSSRNTLPVEAEVLEVRAHPGDRVKKGDIICILDSSDYEEILLQYEEALRAAQIGVEQAELSLENASSSADSVSDVYGDLTLKANSYSQVASIYFDPGEDVAAGSPVVLLKNTATMSLELPFNANDAANISVGSSAKVNIMSSGEELSGTVTKVSSVDTVTSYGGIVRTVTIAVNNPGAITAQTRATASVGDYSCAAAGFFASAEEQTLYAGTNGTIGTIYVNEGGWVSAGGAVLTINSAAVESQQTSSQNSVRAAELALENARMNLDKAQRSYDDALEIMNDHTVRAKIDGVVAAVNFDVGETTLPTMPVAEVYCLDSVKFDMSIDELDIKQFKTGLEVSVTADAVAGESFTGTVTSVGISGVGISGVTTYPVTVVVNQPGGLLPGMNVSADIVVDSAQGVLTIPVSAVSRGNTVLVTDSSSHGDLADGVPAGYRRQEVTLGRSDDNYIEITSGLAEGDKVVLDNSHSSAFDYMMYAFE
ncbi:MAG: efflux RND transporter periplasmic adaptor subunit [Oscillospiraceae bacterium]|nr:efflux RND transporter periplasmic adaptor subunit [Oscillospiraceae bacterium]